MNLLILGASGGVGRQLVSIAERRGFHITAVVRPGSEFQPPTTVRRVEGDLLEPSFLDSIMPGQEAVLCAVGPQQLSFKKPWRKIPASAETYAVRATRTLIESMKKWGVRRVCALGAAGVGDSYAKAGLLARWVLRYSRLRQGLREFEAMEALYAESGLDWLMVRVPKFSQGQRTDRAQVVSKFAWGDQISKADVAAFMLNQLELQYFSEHTPLVGVV